MNQFLTFNSSSPSRRPPPRPTRGRAVVCRAAVASSGHATSSGLAHTNNSGRTSPFTNTSSDQDTSTSSDDDDGISSDEDTPSSGEDLPTPSNQASGDTSRGNSSSATPASKPRNPSWDCSAALTVLGKRELSPPQQEFFDYLQGYTALCDTPEEATRQKSEMCEAAKTFCVACCGGWTSIPKLRERIGPLMPTDTNTMLLKTWAARYTSTRSRPAYQV